MLVVGGAASAEVLVEHLLERDERLGQARLGFLDHRLGLGGNFVLLADIGLVAPRGKQCLGLGLLLLRVALVRRDLFQNSARKQVKQRARAREDKSERAAKEHGAKVALEPLLMQAYSV
eukprot:c12528_g1_i1.p3 GENE.c12528_g1_i1~~c12528_g1_i1.p3  ORF type:complete len:119 (-),score=14.00 c12528_g1_i1:164-520(-)